MEEDGKLVQSIFREDEVVAEKTDDQIISLIRVYDLVASDAENAKTYYHYASDELGSVTHVVDDRDVLNHYEYDVWGNLAVCEEAVPNRFLFTGQQYDGTIQQYYLRTRFYNPAIARFTQEDTYRGDGQNLYTYCQNNPVCYVDPSGHCSKDPDGNQAGSGNDGELLLPAVIPTQPQLPAVIDNYQNGISGPEADTPNNQNRTNGSEGGSEPNWEAHNAANYAKLKEQYRVAELANDLVDSITQTGTLPNNYIAKSQARAQGWSEGKALSNYAPGRAIGGDVFNNTTGILPSANGRIWYEADVGIDYTMSRSNSKNPAYRILYSNDGLIYGTYDHYNSVFPIFP